ADQPLRRRFPPSRHRPRRASACLPLTSADAGATAGWARVHLASGQVPARSRRKQGRALQRAEVVVGPLVPEATSRVIGIDRHAADGIYGQAGTRPRALAKRLVQHYRLSEVAQLSLAALTQLDALERARGRAGALAQHHLAP